jgi:nucleotide-binding universal stress UspA family protein
MASQECLRKVAPTIAGVKYEHHYLTGVPITAIVDFAADNHIDLIVMASHGRSGISRLVLGSIAEGVMRKAPCPVLVVKQPGAMHEHTPHTDVHAGIVRCN